MNPLTIVIIVVVAGLVIWRVIASYMPGTDTRGGNVVDGYSPTYGGGSDSGHDPEPRVPGPDLPPPRLCFYALQLWRLHQTLRSTPVMESGVMNHVWSVEEIRRLTLQSRL